ncbi:YifB family Mg chelatase-like AAA ATPase [Sulfurospirillum arcachonense]|uniref:YifB family Mg chelatase-like AAA ATPase n=1 Tax=Sulfurospirillum arcachonense TaxID=57666 RepID=UPI000468397F|nr:YifB family Mg chelatase-like AAA ATPase [Sulfurospirillum arcachonense]
MEKSTKKFQCATLYHNQALKVEVESAYVRALPGFSIVGMVNQSIQESRDRIKSALSSIKYKFPAQKITVSMSPSDLKKEGSHFDLGIALLLYLQKESLTCKDFYIFGELGLDGTVKSTTSIFPIILSLASKEESLRVIVPQEILQKINQIPNVQAYGVENLQDAIEFLAQEEVPLHVEDFSYENMIEIEGKKYFYKKDFELDFSDIKGQNRVKRAMVISAVGMHNILLEGSPGCGKSMSIKRLCYIMPPMSMKEMLESNAYGCLSGDEKELNAQRAFRSPHHSSSKPSIFGGGSNKAMAGESALAHNGILFFDEFPHFSKTVLEALREPLEDNQILISRVNSKIKYETKFLFAAAQNPCPCGNLLSNTKECRCNELEIKRYKSRISEPLMDRIDIYVQMSEDFESKSEMDSQSMFDEVLNAFIFQKKRGQFELNAKLSEKELEQISNLDKESQEILFKAVSQFGLNHRSTHKIQSIARSIADIAQSNQIKKEHILEALSYRRR